jgi:uncharacterized protein YndB with AHSA1/START domain
MDLTVPPELEITTVRTIDIARETLFNAWTNPDLLQQWWGPAGFTNTFHEFELKPGGRWRFTMHGRDGKGNYPNECTFLKIDKPHLIAWDRISQPLFRVVTTFEEIAVDKTKLVFRMQFKTKEECDKIRKFVPEKNEENFDKLEALLNNL